MLTDCPVNCAESTDIPVLTAREFLLVMAICSAAANALAASATGSDPLDAFGSIQSAVAEASAVAVSCTQLLPGDVDTDWRKAAPLLARVTADKDKFDIASSLGCPSSNDRGRSLTKSIQNASSQIKFPLLPHFPKGGFDLTGKGLAVAQGRGRQA